MSMSARKARHRRRGRQIDNKRARQKERRALDGGTPEVMRSRETWAPTAGQPPLVNDRMPRRSKRSGKKHVKERCPMNGTHEWYGEWLSETGVDVSYRSGYWRCSECWTGGYYYDNFGHVQRQICDEHRIERPYTDFNRLDTCIHCWTERQGPGRREYNDGAISYKGRRRRFRYRW